MKKLLLSLLLSISLFSVKSQSTYSAYKTQIYIWNIESQNWDLDQQNDNITIDVTFFNNRIFVDADTKANFITKDFEKISGDGWHGTRWNGYYRELKENCKIDLIKYDNSSGVMLAIMFGSMDKYKSGYSIRYYF